jgi:hypothetical protein
MGSFAVEFIPGLRRGQWSEGRAQRDQCELLHRFHGSLSSLFICLSAIEFAFLSLMLFHP